MFSKTQGNKNPTGTEAEVSDSLDRTRVYTLLSSERRQTILRLLAERGPLDKTELGDRMAEAEYGLHYDAQERKRVYVSIIQCHLPRLETTARSPSKTTPSRWRASALGCAR